jgi:hypothetical protein
MADYNDRPAGGSGPVLPPSRFGAGYTVGQPAPDTAYPAPTAYPPPVTYPAPEPQPLGALHYPDMAVQQTAPPYAVAPPYPMAPVTMVYAMPPQRTNSMAIAALVSSLVLAPLGIIFGHIALSQIKRTNEDGKGLAIAGLVIGYLFTGFALLWFISVGLFLGALGAAVNDSNYNSATTPIPVSAGIHTQPAGFAPAG